MRVSFTCLFFLLSALGIALGQDTNFSTGPQYLLSYGSGQLARPISTPSMSFTERTVEVGASNATGTLTAGAENQTASPPYPDTPSNINLFPIFYGRPPASIIEISSPSEPSPDQLPPSILDTGVWQLTTAQALRERGYGVTLVEATAYGKARTRHANRVYTNADVDRLHGGS